MVVVRGSTRGHHAYCSRVLLYHRTTNDRADAIIATGWINETASEWPTRGLQGVWMSETSDQILFGSACFAFDIPDQIVDPAWFHEGYGWLVPAIIANRYVRGLL